MCGVQARWAARWAAAVLLALAGLLAGSTAAQAHAVLLFASPAIEGAVPTAPKEISLVFDEPVHPAGTRTLRVTAPGGAAVSLGSIARSEGGKQLTAPVRSTVTPGVCTVVWQAVAEDGDVMSGTYRFAVGAATAGLASSGSAGGQQVSGAPATAVLRWLLFAAFAGALGSLAGEWLTARQRAPEGAAAPKSWTLPAAVAGLVASLGLALLIAGGGSLVRGIASPSASALFDGRPGILALVDIAGWLGAVIALRLGLRRVAAGAVFAAAVAEGLRAHPAAESAVWGPVLTTVHLTAVAVWIGALVHILRVGRAWRWAPPARAALRAYASVALVLVVVVLITGTLSGLLLVSPLQLLDTGFGQVLAVKLALVVAVCLLALAARRRLAHRAPRLLARVEASALVAVLGVTSWLGVTQPPRDKNADLPFAPPPSGNAITVGGRADQIGIAATASQGQVVLRLTAPDTDLENGDSSGSSYEAGLTLTTPGGHSRPLATRGCGDGCFYAPVTWHKGLNLLTVRADAKGWGGGRDTLRVMWPVHPDADLVARTVKAMRAVDRFTLHEQVASDTARASVAPTKLTVTGEQFVDSEPYAKGKAPLSSRFTDAEGNTVLALGFPGERLALELTLDGQDRVVRETLVAPNHFIRRTFTYPEPENGSEDGGHDAGSAGR
ncbi:copper resistance CopC/CopD family protein [Streptomyces sp. NBC_01236]|uniref:copper resistance CopC/CopD family protein n=1 Tax=Streptomyces sp. NBC_01236 TaxID=2903789 RepID=UPI002E153A89|nr:copper resistance protein CopC/CopD [Streptomyces sp. NBC_01236]